MSLIKHISLNLNVSLEDAQIIYDLVNAFPKNNITDNKRLLERQFLHNIKPGHYLVLGFMIGYCRGTDETTDAIYNSINLCRRQN